jgi:hypothetical protein
MREEGLETEKAKSHILCIALNWATSSGSSWASKPTALTLPALGPQDIVVAFSLVCSLPFAAAGCALARNRRQSTQNPDSSFLRGMHPALSPSFDLFYYRD